MILSLTSSIWISTIIAITLVAIAVAYYFHHTIKYQRLAVIASLTADYDLVIYTDASKNNVTFYQVSESFRRVLDTIDQRLPNNRKFDALLKAIILRDDFQQFISDTNRETTISTLGKSTSVCVPFRAMINGDILFYQAKITKDTRKRGGFVTGIRCINAERRKEIENQRLKKELEAKEIAVNKDALTCVNNRTAFINKTRELSNAISIGESPAFAIVECDLNNLKSVNDNHGHEAGDNYIKENCRAFCQVFKHSPVYRIGGDEFAIVLQGSDYEDRSILIRELDRRNHACKPEELDGKQISFAIGMAEFNPQMDESVRDVLKRADTLMYVHKNQQKSER